MRTRKVDIVTLLENRRRLDAKGYCNKKDIMDYVPCGEKKANAIYNAIVESCTLKGIETLGGYVILTERLRDYLAIKKS